MRVFSGIWLVAAGAFVAAGCSGGGGGSGGPANPLPASQESSSVAPVGSPIVPDLVGAQVCVHFAISPLCHKLPAAPSLAGNSAAWAALEFAPGRDAFGPIQISNAKNRYLDTFDDSEPLDELPIGAPSIKQTVACDNVPYANYTCSLTGMNGRVINIPVGMVPAGDTDHHYSYDDYASKGEFDFWDSNGPPYTPSGTLHVGGAGFCKWGGDGTGCSGANAGNVDLALGGISPGLVKAAESSANGSLPHALSVGILCDDIDANFFYPATASDGTSSNSTPGCAGHLGTGQRPPGGTRWFLAMHDAAVNATSNLPWVKVVLRTIDEDHFGGVVLGTEWSQAPEGISFEFQRGNWAFAAAEAGVAYGTDVYLPITNNGIDLSKAIEFCANGTC